MAQIVVDAAEGRLQMSFYVTFNWLQPRHLDRLLRISGIYWTPELLGSAIRVGKTDRNPF